MGRPKLIGPLTVSETKKKQQGVFGNNMFATKTGYTGEMGFEVILPHDQALNLWKKKIFQSKELFF